VGVGITGLETFEYQKPINHDAPAAAPESPRQAEPEATPTPEMTAEPQAQAIQGQDTAQINRAGPVTIRDDEPTEREVFQSQAERRDTEAGTKRQEAELPGAENTEAGRTSPVETARRSIDEILSSIRQERSEGGAEHDQSQDRGQDQDGGRSEAAAAFRSFGR
jgi:hypothetical protein